MLEVSRGKRFMAGFINVITFQGLLIGGLIILITKRTSLGGLAMGYKFEGGNLALLFFTQWLSAIIISLTTGVFWIVDICTMQNRNGTFAESWAGVKKVNN